MPSASRNSPRHSPFLEGARVALLATAALRVDVSNDGGLEQACHDGSFIYLSASIPDGSEYDDQSQSTVDHVDAGQSLVFVSLGHLGFTFSDRQWLFWITRISRSTPLPDFQREADDKSHKSNDHRKSNAKHGSAGIVDTKASDLALA